MTMTEEWITNIGHKVMAISSYDHLRQVS